MKVLRLIGLTAFGVLAVLAQPASAQHCVTVVDIDAAGKIVSVPSLLSCLPNDAVVWVVSSAHPRPIKVTFDKFQIRGTTTDAEPLVVKSHPMTVPGALGVSSVKVKTRGNFGTVTLPYGGFKYAITVTDASGNNQLDYMDPDLDVTPPPTIDHGRGRGRGGR